VFTKNDFRGFAAIHLDAWWDQAELVTLGDQPTPQPTAATQPQPQATAQTQPQATAQPVPGGGLVHTVAAGDTLFALSFQYDVPLEQIYTLNGLNAQSLLSIGQQIIIKPGTGTQVPAAQPTAAAAQPTAASAQPTAAPAQATPPAAEATPQAQTTAAAAPTQVADTSNKSVLCLFAFEDANADGLRQSDEGPVAGAKFKVVDGQGTQVAEYASTDDAQPHCINDLLPGSYSISVQPAPNTTATSDKRWGVPLTGGSTVNINFGSRSGESGGAASSNAPDNTNTSSGTASGGSSVGGIIAGIFGLVLLLAAGVIGAFVIARRRA
jgi:LysM repeat protein